MSCDAGLFLCAEPNERAKINDGPTLVITSQDTIPVWSNWYGIRLLRGVLKVRVLPPELTKNWKSKPMGDGTRFENGRAQALRVRLSPLPFLQTWKIAGYGLPDRFAESWAPRGMWVRIPCLPPLRFDQLTWSSDLYKDVMQRRFDNFEMRDRSHA